ncbi:MAG: hypothetical protein B6U87_00145 [Candidatus Aenigmarchaeota archaeon ex4484_52]|nr:MAG: hypothetical protein B6U87_00145 [Candidatus Aenigmarchaeota archaeon ex4484_52]
MDKITKRIPNSKEILDKAFSRAKKKQITYKKKQITIEFIKKKNLEKIQIASVVINNECEKILQNFPKINQINAFEKGLIDILANADKLKKALYRVCFAQKLNKKLYFQAKEKIQNARNKKDIDFARKAYYGRISSAINKLNKVFLYIEESRNIINKLPEIKQRFTLVICGFPNTGKSTLMSILSGSKPKIMSYAFTTQKLLFGTIDDKIQIIDTPGILDNIDSKNKCIQQSKLAITTIADLIFFIFDFSKNCQYSITDQLKLKKSIEKIISKSKKIVVCINKIDLIKLTNEKKSKIMHLIKNRKFYISAKKNINIDKLRKFLAKKMAETYKIF